MCRSPKRSLRSSRRPPKARRWGKRELCVSAGAQANLALISRARGAPRQRRQSRFRPPVASAGRGHGCRGPFPPGRCAGRDRAGHRRLDGGLGLMQWGTLHGHARPCRVTMASDSPTVSRDAVSPLPSTVRAVLRPDGPPSSVYHESSFIGSSPEGRIEPVIDLSPEISELRSPPRERRAILQLYDATAYQTHFW
jgi:hypothetical protein